jgi:hypothetical protein
MHFKVEKRTLLFSIVFVQITIYLHSKDHLDFSLMREDLMSQSQDLDTFLSFLEILEL